MPEVPAVPVSASRASVFRRRAPTDANLTGNVFGGPILSEVDRVAYISAARPAKANRVTAPFDWVDLHSPVHVGDVVDFEAEPTSVGRTSREVGVRVHSEAVTGGGTRRVGQAFVTRVAVDRDGRPVPVPPLALGSAEERARFAPGHRWMEERRRARAPAGG